MEPSNTWRDLLQGGVSALTSTIATNPLLHWQFCKVENKSFYSKDIWRGVSANFVSYLGFMPVAYLSRGLLRREMDRREWKHTDRSEIIIGILSGSASVIAVCPGERIATMDNNTGMGNLKILKATLKTDGIFELYRGFLPTLGRDSITVGGILTWGPLLRRKFSDKGIDPYFAGLTSSLLTGLVTVVGTQPLQVIRIRLQVDRTATLRGLFNEVKTLSFKAVLRRYYTGILPRTTVNVTLVACGILIDDNLDRFLKT